MVIFHSYLKLPEGNHPILQSHNNPMIPFSEKCDLWIRLKDCNSLCLFDFEMPHLAAFRWIPAEQCWLKAGRW